MDTTEIVCDELLQEIFRRLPPPSSAAVSLVNKRWLRLLRSSTSSLSLRLPSSASLISLSSFLSHHPFLSSLSLSTTDNTAATCGPTATQLLLLLLLSVQSSCPLLQSLTVWAHPIPPVSLISLSTSCPNISSLSISLPRPLNFNWILHFVSLKNLSVVCTGFDPVNNNSSNLDDPAQFDFDAAFELDSLSLVGVRDGDYGFNWVWRNCKTLKKLKLKSCETLGDSVSFSLFIKLVKGLQEVELRTCRSIIDGVLFNLAEHCDSLSSLLIYDGGSKQGLLNFIRGCKCNLRRIDLRLPLDLDNAHLVAIGERFKGLLSLRLESCCLVSGEGLKAIGDGLGDVLEEFALVNCDVVEKESGLLSTLGQSLRRLKILDLSYNDALVDKELVGMLVSCNYLRELRVRRCGKLSNEVGVFMAKNCKFLENVDMRNCVRIDGEAVELFVVNAMRLRRLWIEERKVSGVVRMLESIKVIEVLD